MKRHNENSTLEGLSRREFLRNLGIAGALATAFSYNLKAEGEKYSLKPEIKMGDYYSLGFSHEKSREFNTFAYIDYKKAVESTPEYKKIERENLKQGNDAMYDILYAQASKRVSKAVAAYMREKGIEIVFIGKDKLDHVNGISKKEKENKELDITDEISETYKEKNTNGTKTNYRKISKILQINL